MLGAPRDVVRATAELIHETLGKVEALSPVIDSAPVGPSQRRYANAALVLKSRLEPLELLASLQWLEVQLGRMRRGQRWRARVIDLDVVLWSGGVVAEPRLAVPHPLFRQRDFVLRPAAAVAPTWRDPLTGLTLAHHQARLTRRRPLPR